MFESLTGQLREMICDGRLDPGARIAEQELTVRFGVSRTPLREALKVLAAEGLVELLPNRGARVAATDLADLDNLFAVLAALEGLAGELAASRITDEELELIHSLQAQMSLAFAAADRSRYFELNQAIHDAILTAARNPALTQTHRTVAGRIMASRFQANLIPARWAQAVQEHEAILRLLALRRPVECGQMMRAHILNKLSAIRASQHEPNR